MCFLWKTKTRQGCTTQKTELGMHQNHHFQQMSLKINKNQKSTPPSTITMPQSEYVFEEDQVVVTDIFAVRGWSFVDGGEKHLPFDQRHTESLLTTPPMNRPVTELGCWAQIRMLTSYSNG